MQDLASHQGGPVATTDSSVGIGQQTGQVRVVAPNVWEIASGSDPDDPPDTEGPEAVGQEVADRRMGGPVGDAQNRSPGVRVLKTSVASCMPSLDASQRLPPLATVAPSCHGVIQMMFSATARMICPVT